MKISHVITSIDISTGGPARSVTQLIGEMLFLKNSLNISLETLKSSNPILKKISNYKDSISFYDYNRLGISEGLKKKLKKADVNLLHGHGLWQMSVHQMSKIARERQIPYIITPRGMLEPWALSQGRLKKQLALKLFQYNDLVKASCIHATAPMEVESIRNLGLNNPIAMIPNGIDLENYPLKSFSEEKSKTILFLSRIHPKKGIELLIDAWEKLEAETKKSWQIKIAGNGEQIYIDKLEALIRNKGLQNSIQIIGSQFGDDKINCYHNADLFVLPTYSENFGIVVAESLACGTPVITTKGAPWEELETQQAGWWIDRNVETLKKALQISMQLSSQERYKMGLNGRKLIEDQYSITSVANKMIHLYQWLLKKNDKPDFVILD